MGFVIEPYSLFLFFRLKSIERARALIPERYELVKTRILDDDKEADYYMGYGILNTRATTFWGVRLESYIITRDSETGLLSWIFIDILSNTLIALPTEGVTDPNSREALFTTNVKGEIIADIHQDGTDRHFSLKGSMINGKRRKLHEDLWLIGNTSIAYSRQMNDGNDDPFAVIFDPAEVEDALNIPLNDIELRCNNLFPGLSEPEISKILCFPFAQHYIADSPGCRTYVRDRRDLIEKYRSLSDGPALSSFSARGIKKLLALGFILSLGILIIALLF